MSRYHPRKIPPRAWGPFWRFAEVGSSSCRWLVDCRAGQTTASAIRPLADSHKSQDLVRFRRVPGDVVQDVLWVSDDFFRCLRVSAGFCGFRWKSPRKLTPVAVCRWPPCPLLDWPLKQGSQGSQGQPKDPSAAHGQPRGSPGAAQRKPSQAQGHPNAWAAQLGQDGNGHPVWKVGGWLLRTQRCI